MLTQSLCVKYLHTYTRSLLCFCVVISEVFNKAVLFITSQYGYIIGIPPTPRASCEPLQSGSTLTLKVKLL